MRNSEGEMPVDVAHREGFTDIESVLVQAGRLSTCNLDDSCECIELKKLLFDDSYILKSKEMTKLKSSFEKRENQTIDGCTKDISRKGLLEVNEKSWQEKLESARTEVVTKYESRIAEVEKQYRLKVDSIEKQCSRKLISMRRVLSNNTGIDRQSLIVPSRHFFGSSSSLVSRAQSL